MGFGFGAGGFSGTSQSGSTNGNTNGNGGTGGERKEWTGHHFDPSTAPHFDSQSHTRTHEALWENLKKSHARRQEKARQQAQAQHPQGDQDQAYHYVPGQEEERRAQTQGGANKKVLPEIQQGNWTSFFAVTAVLLVSSFGPYWLFGEWTSSGGKSGGGGGGGGGGKNNGGGGGSKRQAAASTSASAAA